jgi:hypothetical protein
MQKLQLQITKIIIISLLTICRVTTTLSSINYELKDNGHRIPFARQNSLTTGALRG